MKINFGKKDTLYASNYIKYIIVNPNTHKYPVNDFGKFETAYYTEKYAMTNDIRDASKVIYTELVTRTGKFFQNNITDAIRTTVANGVIYIRGGVNRAQVSVEKACEYLAWFAQLSNLIWDDTAWTTYEMDQIKQDPFGAALWKADRFASQQNQTRAAATTSAKRATTSNNNGAPMNDYKSRGPQSGNVINLIGQPNAKINLTGQNGYVFVVEADKLGKNTPRAFVKPLDSSAQSGNANKVFFGSGNGYTDCRCTFNTVAEADAFCLKCQQAFGGKYTNIRTARTRIDSNGYFQVRTVFGDAYIPAVKLNEELEDTMVEEVVTEAPTKKLIGDIDAYDYGRFSSIS